MKLLESWKTKLLETAYESELEPDLPAARIQGAACACRPVRARGKEGSGGYLQQPGNGRNSDIPKAAKP